MTSNSFFFPAEIMIRVRSAVDGTLGTREQKDSLCCLDYQCDWLRSV